MRPMIARLAHKVADSSVAATFVRQVAAELAAVVVATSIGAIARPSETML